MTSVVFWLMATIGVVTAWRVFRTDSMVRAAYWLMASFIAVAVILVLLHAGFLGLVLVLMMAGEMTIMAVFMVMFMMNPAGLNPMTMVHQHRTAIAAGIIAFFGLAGVTLIGEFPAGPRPSSTTATAELGSELLGDSMLVFETVGVTLVATMIGALAIASRKGRYGDAMEGSVEPTSGPGEVAGPAEMAMNRGDADDDDGHSMSEIMGMMETADETDQSGHEGHARNTGES